MPVWAIILLSWLGVNVLFFALMVLRGVRRNRVATARHTNVIILEEYRRAAAS